MQQLLRLMIDVTLQRSDKINFKRLVVLKVSGIHDQSCTMFVSDARCLKGKDKYSPPKCLEAEDGGMGRDETAVLFFSYILSEGLDVGTTTCLRTPPFSLDKMGTACQGERRVIGMLGMCMQRTDV